ncbi:MAG: hypothetical protein FDZ70_03035 [Actinobacteria bacterium]|nr:MAG: hypothetical protein FDZ70_03035 [Actinomycetota bacterium]
MSEQRRRPPARRPLDGVSDPVGYRRRLGAGPAPRRRTASLPRNQRVREGAYVFTKHPARRRAPWVAGAAAAAALVLAVWLWTRPVTVEVTPLPADARVTLGDRSAVGTLTAGGMKPGAYALRVERAGFAPVERTLKAKRLFGTSEEVSLEPLPQQLGVRCVTPKGASITMLVGDKKYSGAEALTQTVPAGPVRVSVAKDGFNTYSTDLFLDAERALIVNLDPKGQLVHTLGMIPCAGRPKGVMVTPDGREAWTTILNAQPSIEIVDPRTGRITGGINLGTHGAVEVLFNKAGTRAYASQMETAKVFEVDVKTRKVLREFKTGSPKNWTKVIELSPDEKTLYASNWSGDSVSIFDLKTGTLTDEIAVAKTPRGLYAADDGMTLWVASFDTGILERVDLESGARETVFKSTGGALRHFVADEKSRRLFTSDMGRDCVWVTDLDTGETKKFVDTDEKPNTIDLSPDAKVLFVSCRGENGSNYYVPGPEWGSILLLDAATGKPLDAIIGGDQCTALDVSDDGKTLVFSDFLDNRLRVYDVPGYAVLAKGGGGRYQAHLGEIRK